MRTVGFIDYYLDEFHANQYPEWIEKASNRSMKIVSAYGKIDAPSGISNVDWAQQRNIALLPSIEAVIENSDCLVILSPDHPQFHKELAWLPLQSGKPTFIDKTFAPDRQTALELFELAEQHNTPLYSSSALRYAPEYANIRPSEIEMISSIGPGLFGNYGVHQFEPIVALLGSQAKKVMYVGSGQTDAFVILFASGQTATVQHFGSHHFYLSASYKDGTSVETRPDEDFFSYAIQDMVRFFESGISSIDPNETITIMTLLEYGQYAKRKPFQWIDLP